jgi:hypothetical protein
MNPDNTLSIPQETSYVKRLARWIATHELILVAVTAPFLLFPSRWTLPAFGLILLGWLARLVAFGRLTLPTASDLPLAILVLTAVTGFLVSADPAMSRAKLWGIVLQVALFYAAVKGLGHRPSRWPAFRGATALLVALTAAVALLGLVGTDWASARLLDLPQVYERLPRLVRGLPGSGVPVASDLFHPREVAATLAMLLPVPAALLLYARDPLLRWLSVAALVTGGFTFVLCASIQAAVGLAMALLLIAVWHNRWSLLAVPLGLLGLAAGLLAYGPQRAALDLLSLDHPLGAGVVLRWDIWSRAWAMVRDAPFTGVGLNTYPVVQTHFYPGLLLGPEPNAHQLFLGTAVDLGLPGLLALLWLLVAFGYTVVRAYRLTPERDLRVLLVGLAAGVLAYVVHGLVDTMSLGAKPVAALFFMLGLAAALQLHGLRSRAGRWPAFDDSAASASPSPALASPNPLATAGRRMQPLTLLPHASLPLAAFLLPLLLCALLAPATPALNLGVLRAHQALVQARASHVPPAAALQAAVAPLREAMARDPDNVHIYGHLGSLHAWLGDYPAALAALEAQAALDVQTPLERYAPFEVLRRRLAGETGQDPVEDLLWVYRHWQDRYSDRAEGYVRTALVWDRYKGDPQRARQALQAGLDQGAEPAGLLAYYLLQLGRQP